MKDEREEEREVETRRRTRHQQPAGAGFVFGGSERRQVNGADKRAGNSTVALRRVKLAVLGRYLGRYLRQDVEQGGLSAIAGGSAGTFWGCSWWDGGGRVEGGGPTGKSSEGDQDSDDTIYVP